jgi:NAD(P)-dependent dehydrogenase (short-subunit alcohol dehydrogenase family)
MVDQGAAMGDKAFRDNVVVVTGASSGIGQALARQLADHGARLAIAARRAELLEGVADECRRRGGEALAVPTDVASQDQCRRFVELSVERYGRIDTLVNNAGINMTTRFTDLPDLRVFEDVMAVNFYGQLYMTHAALPHLRASRGRIVSVCSLKSFFANARADAYTASKHALVGFFGSLRIELAGTGVTVTLVHPPWVATELRTRALDEQGRPWGGVSRHEEGAMSPETCARLILKAAAERRREALTPPRAKLARWMALIAPAVLDRVVAKETEPESAPGRRAAVQQ